MHARFFKLLILVLSLTLPSMAVKAQLKTWDKFSGRTLNTTKWEDNWFSDGALTLKRRVAAGKLELAVSAKGDVLTDSGVTRARNRISLPSRLDGKILAIESRMWVTRGEASYCGRPSAENRSRGRLRQTTTWFNDGSSSGPDDQTGDVSSYLSLRIVPRSVDRKPRVVFWAWRCIDANCDTVQDAMIDNNFLMNVSFNQPVTTTTTYNARKNTLEFSAKSGSRTKRTTIRLASLGQPRAKPVSAFNAIEARAEVDNCNLGVNAHDSRERPFTSVEGRVDQIRIRQGRI